MSITFITILLLNIFDATSDMSIEIAILPVLGLLWGPIGILGFLIVESYISLYMTQVTSYLS